MPIRNRWRDGDWLAVCDRCGITYYASQLSKEWTGFRVCSGCWDPRHPQEYLRGKADPQAAPWQRPVEIRTSSLDEEDEIDALESEAFGILELE